MPTLQTPEKPLHQRRAQAETEGKIVCRSCDRALPATVEYFYPHPTSVFGLRCVCKDCTCAQNAAYRERERLRLLSMPRELKKRGPKPKVRCTRCTLLKPGTLEYFGKSATKKNGLSSFCKACIAAASVASQRKKREGKDATLTVKKVAPIASPKAPFAKREDLLHAPDFLSTCKVAARLLRQVGDRNERECKKAGYPHHQAGWYRCAEQCEEVARRYEGLLEVWKDEPARAKMLQWLSEQKMCDFHAALAEPGPETFAELFY